MIEMATKSIVGKYLPYPSPEEALRYTRELNWEERLVGMTLIKGVGMRSQNFYGIFSLGDYLATGDSYLKNGYGVDFRRGELVRWLRDAVGDEQLAETVEYAEAQLPVEPVAKDAVSMILEARITQYREVLGEYRDSSKAE